MLPVIDYGDIAVVVPNVSAVGKIVNTEDGFGFEIYLSGRKDPLVVGFFEENDAEEARKELIGIIAQYYFAREYGPDFDIEDLMDSMEDEDINEPDEDLDINEEMPEDGDKREH